MANVDEEWKIAILKLVFGDEDPRKDHVFFQANSRS